MMGPSHDDFAETSAQFLDWLQQSGASVSSKIELADLRHHSAGRGVLANQDIYQDEELFSIPRTAILTVETSDLPVEIKAELHDPWLSLIVAMIYEHHHGPESRWRAYFDVLPKDFDTLMYWSDDELVRLAGSAVLEKIGKAAADSAFTEQLIPFIREHAAIFNATGLMDVDILALCHRMGSTIMAYAFDLDSFSTPRTAEDGWEEDSDAGEVLPKGMVPLADMLNADANRSNAKLFYEDDKVVMKTLKAVRKGEELFIDHGLLPRADMLRRYGYITDDYAEYDVVEIPLNLIKEVSKEHLKLGEKDIEIRLEYLDEQGLLDDGYDIMRKTGEGDQFGEEFCVLLNALVVPETDFEKLTRKDKLPKTKFSKESLELLSSILVQRSAIYPSEAVESNHHRLDTTAQNGSSVNPSRERRRIMASQVIAGEKEVLQEATETVQEMLGDSKNGNPTQVWTKQQRFNRH